MFQKHTFWKYNSGTYDFGAFKHPQDISTPFNLDDHISFQIFVFPFSYTTSHVSILLR